jgi:hypothetical protein
VLFIFNFHFSSWVLITFCYEKRRRFIQKLIPWNSKRWRLLLAFLIEIFSSPGATCTSLHACDFMPMRSFFNVKILKPSIHRTDLSSMLVNPCGLCMYVHKMPKSASSILSDSLNALFEHFLCFLFVWIFLIDVNSLICNDKRPSISFRAHEHSVDPDSCVKFTCAVYLYLRWWHTIFSVKRSSCVESKPSFRFLSGRFKISLRHQCFQSNVRYFFLNLLCVFITMAFGYTTSFIVLRCCHTNPCDANYEIHVFLSIIPL